MKKILITILLSFFGFMSYSQVYNRYDVVSIDSNLNNPRYLVGYTDTKADTIGIVLTIQQAQKIDNDLELLNLYKQVRSNCDSTVNFLVRVVDNYKKMNIVAQQTFKTYESSIANLKLQIGNLNNQIEVKDNQLFFKENIIRNKDLLIELEEKEIKQLKRQKNGLVIGGVSLGVGFIYMLLGHPGIR